MSVAFPSLLLTTGILTLMYRDLRGDCFSFLVAVLLFLAIRWNVFYTDKLTPDIYVSFFLFAAWYVYQDLRTVPSNVSRGALFAGLLLLAFMSKGTILLIAPLFVIYLVIDVVKGDGIKWKWPLIFSALFLSMYFLVVHILTGSCLSRFDAIEANKYSNSCSYDQMPWSEVWDRLTVGFFEMLWSESLFLFIGIIAFAAIYGQLKLQKTSSIRKLQFYLWTVLVLFLSMNFMSFSLTSYSPGCLNMRHYLFMMPIMGICCGKGLGVLRLSNLTKCIVVAGLCIAVVPSVRHALYARSIEYPNHKAEMVALASKLKDRDKVFVSNQVMVNILNFYTQYQYADYLLSPSDFNLERLPDLSHYLVSNWYTEFHSHTDTDQLKEMLGAQCMLSDATKVLLDGDRNILIWRIDTCKD